MLDVPTLQGANVILRETVPGDVDDRVFFGRPKEFAYMCGGNRDETVEFPPRSEWEDWYRSNLVRSDSHIKWMIVYRGKCVGSASLHDISPADRSARYGIGIFAAAYFSRGIGTETGKLVLQYAFDVLKLHRVDLKVLDYNKRGIRCYEKCGFQLDGILRDSAFIEGAYHSDLIMSILEPEFHRRAVRQIRLESTG